MFPLNKSASELAMRSSCSSSAILAFSSSVDALLSSVSAFADSQAVFALNYDLISTQTIVTLCSVACHLPFQTRF